MYVRDSENTECHFFSIISALYYAGIQYGVLRTWTLIFPSGCTEYLIYRSPKVIKMNSITTAPQDRTFVPS
jgi:hypothetical protein